jgi:cytochrome P450
MLWFLIKIILGIPLSIISLFILVIIIRESVSHLRITFYLKQLKKSNNIVVDTTTALMRLYTLLKDVKKHKDMFESMKIKHNSPEYLSADMVLRKDFTTNFIQIVPLSEKCYVEYFQKELEHTAKISFAPIDYLGFIFQNGEKAMHQRTVFKEIFNFERLKKTLPTIRKIVRARISDLKK